ncbi:ribosome biogenesis regulatory protein [Chloropicon primus]|uniref:Ribosome biogenesis regulatory protein n=2 Tax=Chloropicon primus TaxID=1764295 RepID=A0A5B8MCJ2_9CHLO|nr:ribosome biogenesis regulatory protein [Chloropicon primus]UPQ97312.1 ribosome biogenesis regulatory protein [Chloropicon primus]|eukprot:QDZ18099.1 ribosome biogenesis regulatory protein [Chloropicon primus]
MGKAEALVVTEELMGGRGAGSSSSAVAYDEALLEIDEGNLLVCDPSPVDKEALIRDAEGACKEMATGMAQALVKRLFTFPSTPAVGGRTVELPKPKTLLPRFKPVPKPKPLTRWEKFAKEKGIVKRKRDKYTFDEHTNEFKRRYGYDRVNDINDVAIIEAKSSDKLGEDPFSNHKKEKRERVKRQEERRLTNLKNAAKQGGKKALPATVSLARALPSTDDYLSAGSTSGFPKGRKKADRKDLLEGALAASESTASMGKFDRKSKLDKRMSSKKGKRQQFAPVVGKGKSTISEVERDMIEETVRKVISKGSKPILDVNKAVKQIDPRSLRVKKAKTPKKKSKKARERESEN